MFVPELLYQLNARDHAVSWLDPLGFTQAVSTAAAAVESVWTNTTGRILVLTNVFGRYDPGAGQNVVRALVSISSGATGTTVRLAGNDAAGAADLIRYVNWQGWVLVPHGADVSAYADFNAAVAANETRLDFFGVLIPQGNIGRL